MTNKDLIEQIELLIETGEVPTALELCDNAILAFPNDPTFPCLKGVAYQQLGEFSKALYYHTQCITMEPQYFICWSCISIIHLEMLEMEKAHHAILRTIRTGPRQAESWWLRAIFRELQGDVEGGERAYRHANWLNPRLVPAMPILDDQQITQILFSVCTNDSIDMHQFEKYIDIVCIPAPDIIQLRESEVWESPIHILFSFDKSNARASITCYRQNLRRALAEEEDIKGYLSSLITPQVATFLQDQLLD